MVKFMIGPTMCICSKPSLKTFTIVVEEKGHCLPSVCMNSVFLSTHRDTKLGHWDVIRVNTETHTLLDVWCEAPGLWWTFTFLLSGAPGKKKRKQRGRYSWIINPHTHMHAVTWSGFSPFHLLPSGRRRMSHRSPTDLSYFMSSTALDAVAANGNLVSMGGAAAFKTMNALYMEVELVCW